MPTGKWLEQAQERTESFYEEFPVEPGDVVFLGDSLTEQANWYEMFPDIALKNRGVGGETTAEILARLELVTGGQPSKLFVMMGTNDLNAGESQQNITANYELLMSRVAREAPGTELFIQSLLPREAEMSEAIEAINAELKLRTEQRSLTFIDLYPAFLGSDGGIRQGLANDDLHLMAEGYRLWQRELAAYLTK